MVSIVITRQTTWQAQGMAQGMAMGMELGMAMEMEHGDRHECGCHHFGNAREATQKRV